MGKGKKILISRLGAIGDVVHTTVIQQTIKEKYPEHEIHFLTSDFIAPLIQNDPNLSKVYGFNTKEKDNWLYILWLGLKLRQEKYDYIINLQNAIRNIVLNYIAAPQKIVKRNPNRIHAFDAFLNTAKDIFPDLERPQDLQLHISEEIKSALSEKISQYPRPFIVINPGGQNDNQRQGRIWPLSHWKRLTTQIQQKFGGTIFVTGSKQELDYHKEITQNPSIVSFTGQLSLDESAALFSFADLFLSGDSGPLHMAAALGINTIGLMGSTPAIASGPFGTKCHSIISKDNCVPCGQKICPKLQEGIYTPCMQSISPEEVMEFISKNIFA